MVTALPFMNINFISTTVYSIYQSSWLIKSLLLRHKISVTNIIFMKFLFFLPWSTEKYFLKLEVPTYTLKLYNWYIC